MRLEQSAAGGDGPCMRSLEAAAGKTVCVSWSMRARARQADIHSQIATVLVSHSAGAVEGFAVGWHAGGELQVRASNLT